MLTRSELDELVQKDLMPGWRKERERLDRLDRWYRWDPEDSVLPRGATKELKLLRELSRVPWLGLVVTSTAQCLFVDGFRSALDPVGDHGGTSDTPPPPEGPWRIWQANQLDKRQAAIHRATLAYGYAYATVLPGQDFQGNPMPVIRGVSPRSMWAAYTDPAEDDWPEYAIRVMSQTVTDATVKVYDYTFVYNLIVRSGGPGPNGESAVALTNVAEHGAGVCPVVRYTNELDLDGRTPGEIEPHIPLAARINKTGYDRMLVQHYNSWKIRWIAGLNEPDTEEGAVRQKQQLRQDDLLIFVDADTKTGALPETGLGGFIEAANADIEQLAAVTQTPTHELTGKLINLSAEALAAARASQTQKVDERKRSFGAAHVQALRLASHLDGDTKHAEDITGRVTWQDTSIRSMAQAVDALGKAATMLHIPDEVLWGRIPGVERADVEEWIRLARSNDPIEQMQAQLARQATPALGSPSPSSVPPAGP